MQLRHYGVCSDMGQRVETTGGGGGVCACVCVWI